MSPQTCHQGSQEIQALYQTETKKKREISCLSERGHHQPSERNLAYREPALFKTPQGHAADLAARICRALRRTLFGGYQCLTQNLSLDDRQDSEADPIPLHKTGPVYHQARNPFTKTDTYQNQSMGRSAPWLPRSRYRRPLRRLHRRHVRQYHRLRRYRHRMD